MVCVAAAAWLAGRAAAGATFGLDTGYPGPPPGAAKITVEGRRITAETSAIALSWTLSPQGLKPAAAIYKGKPASENLPLGKEVFQIVLTDGTRYLASALVPVPPLELLTVNRLPPDAKAARLAARIPGMQVDVALGSADGHLTVLWSATVCGGSNYVRQQLFPYTAQGVRVKEVIWFDASLPGTPTTGKVDGSPIVSSDWFFSSEDPHAKNAIGQSSLGLTEVSCRVPGGNGGDSFVIGVAPPGQMRRAFLYYLERERAHPYRTFLQYNSWYDIAWDRPVLMDEKGCLDAIRGFGENLIKKHGVVMDSLVFDDGWDDPRTLWQFHSGFPRGFAPLADLCKQYGTRLGVWLSPFGGYAESRKLRLEFGKQQGYEINDSGFSLAGPKYYAAFKQCCLNMIRKYGVNYFKFDGIASYQVVADGNRGTGAGADYFRDTEAMCRLMLELRQEDPQLFINLTTGSWPSPFWLRYADSLWRQGGDMGLAGRGSHQQQWLTYRDREVYRNIACKGPLYPLNSLMTQAVSYAKYGPAGDPTFNSAGFKDDVRAVFGSGTCLQELYVRSSKLTDDDWRVLAEAAKWSRANADVLVDTHWLGGDPGKLEVYGYASWSPRKGIVMLRNPDDKPHEFMLDVKTAFELPPGAATRYGLRSPWDEDAAVPMRKAEAGKPLQMTLKPWEVMILEAQPWERITTLPAPHAGSGKK